MKKATYIYELAEINKRNIVNKMTVNIIKELLEKSDASGSKSTILKPLTWLLSVLIAGLFVLFKADAPSWMIVFFVVLISIIVLLFLFAYIYCLFRDRDALRSEKFSIQKMAIEKGIYGDNITGLHNGQQNMQLIEQAKPLSDDAENED